MSDRSRFFCALSLSALVLLIANLLVPPPALHPNPEAPLVVELVHDDLRPPEQELPFVPQQVPDRDSMAPEKATVADAFNRRVERETMARRTAVAPKRPSPAQPAKPGGPSNAPLPSLDLGLFNRQLDLDLDFLASPTTPRLQGGPQVANLEIEEGEETWLNSQRIRHGGFFRRLHQSVARHWDPNTVMRQRDPTGMLYGSEDRVTVLHLRLEADGGLAEKPRIIRPSGLGMLDREAVRAVVAAAPFPNPPSELVSEGIIDLGRFSFYLQIERGTYGFRPVR